MIRRILFWLAGYLPCRLISRDGAPYLERYFVCQVFGLTVYLHRFVDADGDEEVHNHPWNAMALCLAGGYVEERMRALCIWEGWVSRFRVIFPGRPNFIGANDFHRIQGTKPETWTLFVHGRVRIGWGFLKITDIDDGRFVMFHQPFPLISGQKWWLEASKGRAVGRQPLPSNYKGNRKRELQRDSKQPVKLARRVL